MRRHQREEPAIGFRGGELRWLVTGILMLVVLFMLMSRLREPGTFHWLADFDRKPAEPQTSASAKPLPPATGPTDEDPDQAETAKSDFQAMIDGGLNLAPEEMVPYNRLVFWAKNQSFARLWARAKKGLAYTYLYDDANKYRGELVALDVEVRLVRGAEKNEHGVALNEVWATSRQSGDRLYVCMVLDMPSGIPIGRTIGEKARFAGYFLKLQGYHPNLSKPGDAPERAPLLIGRLEWTPPVAPSSDDESQEWIWGLAALAIVVVVLVVWFMFGRQRRRSPTRCILTPPSDAVIPVDLWLEQSGFEPSDDEKSRTGDGESPSSPSGP